MNQALEILGHATAVDRAYLFENRYKPETDGWVMCQRFEWNSGTAAPQIDNPNLQEVPFEATPEFCATPDEPPTAGGPDEEFHGAAARND